MKFLKNLAIITCLISPNAIMAQGYDVEGTDYYKAKANTQIWLEDASNLYIEMAKAFSCIIADSRTDATPNGTWTTLIDETKCGLGDPGGKSVVLGSGVNQSSRASNETPQEGSIWFSAADGNKYVVSVALHESAEDFAPYGRWNFAYYMYSSPEITGETFTAIDSPATGFVLVSKDTDTNNPGGVVIESFDKFEGEEFDSVRGKFIFSADLKTAKFIGRDQSVGGDGPYDQGQAGRTNENYYFQVSADYEDGELDEDTLTEACYARNSSWKTGYEAALYDYTTGEEIPFTGSFSFTTTVEGSSTRGYYSQWGVWLADEDMLPNPSSPSLDIVDNASNAFDLIWTSGELLDSTGTSVLTSSDYLTANGGTKFTCTSSDTNDCFLGSGNVNEAPFSYEEASDEDGLEVSSVATEKYILSNASHTEPLTLFHDANGNGLIDSVEKPIRYDFFVEWDNDDRREEWNSYSSDNNGARSWNVSLGETMSLKDSENNVFDWKLNYYKWDHKYVALKADGSKYEITPTLFLEKDYDFATDDTNGGRSKLTDEEGEYWILAFDSANSSPGRYGIDEIGQCLCTGTEEIINNASVCTSSDAFPYICEIDLEELKYNSSGDTDNTNTVFEFNGQSLYSQYYGGVETRYGYINVLNPKNGTILTDVNNADKKYVVLNREMGDYLDRLDEGDEAACNDISFETLADLGLSLSDIPGEEDYTLPQFSWSDQPTVTSDTCEVVIGKLGAGC